MEDRQMSRKNLDHKDLLIALYHLSYWSQVEEKYFVDNVYYLSQLCVPLLKLVKYHKSLKQIISLPRIFIVFMVYTSGLV